MKICFIAKPNSFHTRRWLTYFANQGHDVHLIITHRPKTEFSEILGVTFHDLTITTNMRKLSYIPWALAVRRLVHQLQPDLLHAHQVTIAGWLGWATGYHPFVVTPWGSDLYRLKDQFPLSSFLARRVLSNADLVTADSDDLLALSINLGADPDHSQIIQWGIDLTTFFPIDNRAEVRARFGIGDDELVILSPRVLKTFYRHNTTVDAIPTVHRIFPNATFVFRDYNADPPDYAARLEKRAQALGVSESVRFIGPIEQYQDVINIYRIADIVVSIPITDGTPLSVLEAFACGIPVIASDFPSLHEWITDGQNGLLVSGDDAESLAQAIIRLLTNNALYTQIREQALRVVHERADHSAWMARVESLYKELIQ